MTVDAGLKSGADQARWLARYITGTWEELGQPCDRAVVDRALALCERRAAAFDPERAVLVHNDAHGWNTLAAGNGTYKFVDAEGLWSEREHDLAVAIREYNDPLLDGDTASLVRERRSTWPTGARSTPRSCGNGASSNASPPDCPASVISTAETTANRARTRA